MIGYLILFIVVAAVARIAGTLICWDEKEAEHYHVEYLEMYELEDK